MPTSDPPITYLSSQISSFSYQKAGIVAPKCGSVDSIGIPLAVCWPEITQLLLAVAWPTSDSSSYSIISSVDYYY